MLREIHPDHDDVYPAKGGYAHAIAVDSASRFVFTSGTMGLEPDRTIPGSVNAQLALAWSNIRAILAADGLGTDDIVHVTSYLSHPGYAQANAEARAEALGGRHVATTVIAVQLLDPRWLVEIQAVAAKPLEAS